jgi:hypothetical protein
VLLAVKAGDKPVFAIGQAKGAVVASGVSAAVVTRLPTDTPSHVAIVCGNGRLTAYLNGKAVGTSDINVPDAKAKADKVMFGGSGWRGRLQGLALFGRALTADEVAENAGAWKARVAKRKPVERVTVLGKLIRTTATPNPKDIGTYTRCLVPYTYDIERVVKGTCDATRIVVLHWGILGKKVIDLRRKTGQKLILTLEPYDNHPQLTGERVGTLEVDDADLPQYYDVGTR